MFGNTELKRKVGQLEAKIAELQIRKDEIHSTIREALDQWAVLMCPYRVGDITTAKGYSYTGKQCRILQISGKIAYSGKLEWKVDAVLIKKDGTDGRQIEWDSWGDKTQKKEESCR